MIFPPAVRSSTSSATYPTRPLIIHNRCPLLCLRLLVQLDIEEEADEMEMVEPLQLSVAVAVNNKADVRACVEHVADVCKLAVVEEDASGVMITGLNSKSQQLALACLLHWSLTNAGVETPQVAVIDITSCTRSPLHEVLGCEKTQLEPLSSCVHTVEGITLVNLVVEKSAQIVDCRAEDAFLGVEPSNTVSGHLSGASNVPFAFILDAETETFLPSQELLDVFEGAGIDMQQQIAVVSSNITEAAAVATALLLAGHKSVSLCLTPLSYELVNAFPVSYTADIFTQDGLLYADQSSGGAFDLSPLQAAANALTDVTEINRAYTDRINNKGEYKPQKKQEDESEQDEIVWIKDGHRFFDMPKAVTKDEFLNASQAIYRVVSFVLAPFGFPATLHEKMTLSEVKTQSGSLFQDVIEVCSDMVYAQKGLTEGAMAMSVHKWIEEKKDADCSARVKAINEIWDVIYDIPRVVEVKAVDEDDVVTVAKELRRRLLDEVAKRTPWALSSTEENGQTEKEEEREADSENTTTSDSTHWRSMYPSVVYALGFMPQEPSSNKKKLSTLQIKSFIQAVAEAAWDVIRDKQMSQIEFQALCDTLTPEKRDTVVDERHLAEQSLYVMKHFLTRSVTVEDTSTETLASVRNAVASGDRKVRSGRHHAALTDYSQAFAHLPIHHKELDKVLVGRANCFIELDQLTRARTEAEIALKLNPFSAGAYNALGRVEEKLSHPQESMQHYVTSFILDGSRSPEHAESIDRVSRLVGRNVAKDIFNEMVMVHEMPSEWLVQSYFDSFEHDVDYAARVPFDIEKSVSRDHADLDAPTLLYRAIHFKRQRKYHEAQRDLFAVVKMELEPELQAMALNLHASFLYVVGDVNAAVVAISESLQLNPSSVNALVKKGGFLSELGEMEQAAGCFDEAMELDPNEADVHLHMGQMELLNGNYYKAVQCLRRSLSRSDALAVTHVSYGMALYKSGSIYQATDVFEEAAVAFPKSPEVHLFYGEVLADQGNYAAAMKHFLKAFELSPQCPLPFLNAGRVYVSTNDPMRAIAHFEQALVIDPRCSSAHLDIAQVLFAQGRTAEAMSHFDTAATCCRFLPEIEEVCACREMAKMQLKVTEILGVELRHIMRSR